VLGFKIMENFRAPYLSKSIAEFWHRWHISLSTWFRDYIYIPLGGNRKGKYRKYLNIIIVFLISGVWHGNGVTFIIWGLLHGLYQVIGFVLMPVRDRLVGILNIDRASLAHRIYKTVFTFALVNFAWIFFRAENLEMAKNIILDLKGFSPWILFDGSLYNMGMELPDLIIIFLGMIVVVISDVYQNKKYNAGNVPEGILDVNTMRYTLLTQPLWLRWIVSIFAILFIVVFGLWGPGYNSESFIYGGF